DLSARFGDELTEALRVGVLAVGQGRRAGQLDVVLAGARREGRGQHHAPVRAQGDIGARRGERAGAGRGVTQRTGTFRDGPVQTGELHELTPEPPRLAGPLALRWHDG